MTQFYMGCKQVQAWPAEHDGKPGYGVKYPDGYQSWSPKDTFEAAYIPMGDADVAEGDIPCNNENRVTQEMVEDFIAKETVTTLGGKTTVVCATLRNGFEIVASSSCVDPENYIEEVGADICRDRIHDQVWHLLGFALQWARSGVKQSN